MIRVSRVVQYLNPSVLQQTRKRKCLLPASTLVDLGYSLGDPDGLGGLDGLDALPSAGAPAAGRPFHPVTASTRRSYRQGED